MSKLMKIVLKNTISKVKPPLDLKVPHTIAAIQKHYGSKALHLVQRTALGTDGISPGKYYITEITYYDNVGGSADVSRNVFTIFNGKNLNALTTVDAAWLILKPNIKLNHRLLTSITNQFGKDEDFIVSILENYYKGTK